jgi:integrase
MRITDFFESIYKIKKLRGRSQNTVRLYRFSVRNLEKTLGRPAILDDFNDSTVETVMQGVLDRGGSPYTANKERSQLLAMWRFAAQTGLVSNWPTVAAEREPERAPEAWLVEDVHQLFDVVDGLTTSIGDAPASVWWKCLLSICLDTGERIGAVSQAQWSWLDRRWLLVPAEARKGRKRDRRYLLSEETIRVLADLRKHTGKDKQIFVWPYCSTYLWTKFTRLLKNAGLPCGPKDKFHKFRRTVASVAYAAGLDAQDLLDHENRRTTQRYLDARFTRKTQASDVLAEWLRNPQLPAQQKQA